MHIQSPATTMSKTNLGTVFLSLLPYRLVKFKDMDVYHQKALIEYMIEGAWECLWNGKKNDKMDQWLPRAIERFGECEMGVGFIRVDKVFQDALMATLPPDNGSFESNYSVGKPSRKYCDPWPVILSSPEQAPESGLLQDGWHRFSSYWMAGGHREVAFLRYPDETDPAMYPDD